MTFRTCLFLSLVALLFTADPALSADPGPRPLDSPLTARAIAFEFRYGRAPGSPASPANRGLSNDKALHIVGSAVWTLSVYAGARRLVGWPHRSSLGAAAGSAAALGVLKEMYDASTIGGRASGGDLLANALGIGVGVGIVLAR